MPSASSELQTSIGQRLARVQSQIDMAANRARRSPEAVRLVVVTKAQPVEVVEAAIRAGARILGENYAEEAVTKIEALRGAAAAAGNVEWHMIGHIQGRKARLVAPHFDLIHSLDSVKLARRLDSLAADMGRRIRVLLELNVGGESGKQGWNVGNRSTWPELLREINIVAALTHIQIRGLMTMPPLAVRPEDSRGCFRLLRELQTFMSENVAAAEWSELSMGTSTDFTVAVEEGATLVRVGEAIVGARPLRETK